MIAVAVPVAVHANAHAEGMCKAGEQAVFNCKLKESTDEGPDFSAGIVVYRKSKRIADLTCNNDASIHQEAYEQMPTEAYRDIDAN